MKKISFYNVKISQTAISLVNSVLQSGWINEGSYVKDFEEHLSKWTGGTCIAVNSCTSALHLSLVCEGIGSGDEVIIPTQTFVATATAVLQCGAIPVFADIDFGSGNILPESIVECITEHTKAIIPVHFGGIPCKMNEIGKIASDNKLVVIEDAAHAFGATYQGKLIGTHSKYVCFSFQAIKLLTTGDGGAISINPNSLLEEDIRTRKWFGINKNTVKKAVGERLPSMDRLGFKYNMNNIAAAIGVGNLQNFELEIMRRREIAAKYRQGLKNVAGIRLMDVPEDCDPSYWLFTVLADDRDWLVDKMNEEWIETQVVNYGIDREPFFQLTDEELSTRRGQRDFDRYQINLPIHSDISDEDVNRIIAIIKKGW